ncbi:MAG: gliding motility associated protein GldN [Sphingobacteriales bacterium]|nr:gliding motility associated protein GldN [Sphingobacteriales bacterium]
MKRKIITTLLIAITNTMLFAQAPNLNNGTKPAKQTDRPLDGYYKKSNILNAKVTPYASLREVDVMFSKRIWREIDLRDKMNMAFASPKARLIDILMGAIMAGELTAYDATPVAGVDINGDEFSTILKPEAAMSKFADSVLVPIIDKDGNQTGTEIKPGEFNPDSIVKFRIKEDWVFDKQRSIYEPRIVGIAPMVKKKVGGQSFDDQPAFWIYFPEARQVLATNEVVNRHNDATGLSFDDVFVKRLFASYIVKESNSEDLKIKDYAQGIDKLYESERVKKELLDYEHDLWSY